MKDNLVPIAVIWFGIGLVVGGALSVALAVARWFGVLPGDVSGLTLAAPVLVLPFALSLLAMAVLLFLIQLDARRQR